MIRSGEVADAKTIAAVQAVKLREIGAGRQDAT